MRSRDRLLRAPSVGWQKVVARFNDGRNRRWIYERFPPVEAAAASVPNPRQGESTFIPLAQLKALFFVREFFREHPAAWRGSKQPMTRGRPRHRLGHAADALPLKPAVAPDLRNPRTSGPDRRTLGPDLRTLAPRPFAPFLHLNDPPPPSVTLH